MLIYSYRLRYGLGEPSTSYSCKRAGPAESLRNPDAGPRIRQDLSSGARRARLRWRLFHGLEHYSRCATAAVMFKFRAEESQAFEQGVLFHHIGFFRRIRWQVKVMTAQRLPRWSPWAPPTPRNRVYVGKARWFPVSRYYPYFLVRGRPRTPTQSLLGRVPVPRAEGMHARQWRS